MVVFPSPFGGGTSDDDLFDSYDEFAPEHLPEADVFLDGHTVLTDAAHVAFHRTTRDVFEERGVYDMTFGYNLARLNLDTRHPDAGYRYAEDADDSGVLRAEFTPTTPFCPQCDTLATGSFRAWNDLSDRHDYDIVRVRVTGHHRSEEINEGLARLEEQYRKTGSVRDVTDGQESDATDEQESNAALQRGDREGERGWCSDDIGSTSRGYGPDSQGYGPDSQGDGPGSQGYESDAPF